MSKRTSIRIPDDLYAQIVERAKDEQRTVSNLVVLLLREKFQDTKLHESGSYHTQTSPQADQDSA